MAVPPEQPPVYPPPGNPADPATAPMDPIADPRAADPRVTDARGSRAYRDDRYGADPRPAYWRLEGLRTGLTIVGLLALIAIGLAVWALIRADHNRRVVSRGPANSAALVALNRRVSSLETTVHTLRSSGGSGSASTASLAAKVAALQQSQKQLASQLGHGGSSAQVSQLASKEAALSAKVSQWVGKEAALSGQVASLQGRVSQLAGQVRQLQAQSGQTTTTGTTGG